MVSLLKGQENQPHRMGIMKTIPPKRYVKDFYLVFRVDSVLSIALLFLNYKPCSVLLQKIALYVVVLCILTRNLVERNTRCYTHIKRFLLTAHRDFNQYVALVNQRFFDAVHFLADE